MTAARGLAKEDGEDGDADGGELVGESKAALSAFGISVKRYLDGQVSAKDSNLCSCLSLLHDFAWPLCILLGPAHWPRVGCRRFLKHRKAILNKAAVAAATDDQKNKAEWASFVARYMAVFDPLDTGSHYTRAVRELTEVEVWELEKVCLIFGVAWRKSYPHRRHIAVKGQIIEVHMPEFARLHPHGTLVRRLVRYMQNPEARHAAHTLHLEGKKRVSGIVRVKFEREKCGGARQGVSGGGDGP